MAEAEDHHTTSADPLEMPQEEAQRMIGWLLELRRRMLYHHRSLELADDKQAAERDVAIAELGELLKFAGRDRVLRPLGRPLAALAFALEDGTPGRLTAYSKPKPAVAVAPKGGRPLLDSEKRLRGVVAHLVETLVAGDVFGAIKAAEEVAEKLNAAGYRMPNGQRFKAPTVTDWHEHVKYHAKGTDLDRAAYDSHQRDLKRRRPEHVGWDRQQLKAWLIETVPLLARTGL